MAFIGNDLTTIVKQGKKSYVYTATASQTDFTGSDDNGESLAISVDSFVNVFLNGIRLIKTTDYTLSENTVTLTSAASADDELVIVADIEASTFNTYTKSETDARITSQVNGLIDAAPEALNTLNELAAALGDDANFATTVTNALNARYTSTEVDNLLANINSVQVSGTEPTDKSAGLLWYNTGNTTLYVANGSEYLKVSAAIPTLTSVTGTIYAGAASTLTLSGTNFLSTNLVVTFTFNSTDYDVTVTPSSDTSATVAVPSGLYNVLTGSDNVSIKVTNTDNVSSNTQSKTATGLPTGGIISTAGAYRVHTFTSSGSFIVPAGMTVTADILRVAGGGAGGGHGGNDGAGGGGAGGMLVSTGVGLSSATYTATVGAGAAGAGGATNGSNGSNTTFSGLATCIGGGGGSTESAMRTAGSGGSGGGAGGYSGSPGSGTSGQGNDGGSVNGSGSSGGGGGAGAAGNNVGVGGVGLQNAFRTGSNQYYAGGGGGSGDDRWQIAGGAGGLGGGGAGASDIHGQVNQAGSGAANTGGGGGGAAGSTNSIGVTSGGGGSGIVVIRYQL